MLVGYMRLSRIDEPGVLEEQRRVLIAAGVAEKRIFQDRSMRRIGLDACLQSLRPGDVLVVWRLDRLGRSLRHLVAVVHALMQRGVGLKVLTGEGAALDTTVARGVNIADLFMALTEFERNMAMEFTHTPTPAGKRTRKGGPALKLSEVQLRTIQLLIKKPHVNVTRLCDEMGISRQTFYRYVSPDGELRPHGIKLLQRTNMSNDSD